MTMKAAPLSKKQEKSLCLLIVQTLGAMYGAGGEFTENIDKAGGEGTAKFVERAISIYCK